MRQKAEMLGHIADDYHFEMAWAGGLRQEQSVIN
jgi:hypothetical protein